MNSTDTKGSSGAEFDACLDEAFETATDGCDAVFRFDSPQDLVLTFFGRYPGGSATGDPEVIHKVRHLHFSI